MIYLMSKKIKTFIFQFFFRKFKTNYTKLGWLISVADSSEFCKFDVNDVCDCLTVVPSLLGIKPDIEPRPEHGKISLNI